MSLRKRLSFKRVWNFNTVGPGMGQTGQMGMNEDKRGTETAQNKLSRLMCYGDLRFQPWRCDSAPSMAATIHLTFEAQSKGGSCSSGDGARSSCGTNSLVFVYGHMTALVNSSYLTASSLA
ncbi:hypothetical protein D4764_06G0000840 [Takifugu flavidus]|uniref:Uncharacterized protein n=1 Tax=Takifugu flavidus TaxID=433684 RepID=A0A5C6MTD4_9TELE|nr:hypothetical protein D4764_06G0000840 [Takifugu flavidus]